MAAQTLAILESLVAESSRAALSAGRLEAMQREGAAAFPDLPLTDREWAEWLASQLPSDADAIEEYLEELRAADAHLVIACLAGRERALRAFDARLLAVAPQALSGIRLGAVGVEEVLQTVREKLLVSEEGRPRLLSYSARGSLDGWLRVTVARAALSLLRGRDPTAARGDDAEAIVSSGAHADPALETLRRTCGPLLKKAVEESLATLSPEERTLLRLHFVDGLSIDDLAVVYQVHRATTARRLARIRAAIFETARGRIMSELAIGETDFQSLMGVLLSRMDFTLARWLE